VTLLLQLETQRFELKFSVLPVFEMALHIWPHDQKLDGFCCLSARLACLNCGVNRAACGIAVLIADTQHRGDHTH